jgi:hypothetical protein
MSRKQKSLNDDAWEKLFEKYDILHQIDANGQFKISAAQIKEFREPRLMAKFDHKINLPKIFTDNCLAILPITRGDYVISHFDAYHKFESENKTVTRVSLPTYIQSLNTNDISSEAIALNCAVASGIIPLFLQDEALVATVSGRMGSGSFDFKIKDLKTNTSRKVSVNNSQIEIDAAYEGLNGLAIFEAKRDISEDFLVRQLYYPFRVWQSRVAKPVRPIFLVYSNGIYRLYEYSFADPQNYNSIILVNQKNYTIEDTRIEISDIQSILYNSKIADEPKIPFPQANSFERVINICELLDGQELSRNEITEQYAFDSRQTNYYTDAARYLNLLERRKDGKTTIYTLSDTGKNILHLSYKQRQLAFCKLILSHKAFANALRKYFEIGSIPTNADIVQIMKNANLYSVDSQSTFVRRSSTIKGWLNWIIGLTEKNQRG